ncbi:MAG: transcriptional repressor [Planctomycetota bacterium]|nr:transcriptional repressor [Planctomycetota bacterium]
MRMTDQRRAILAAFNAATGPLSPIEVLEVAGAEVPQLNLTTVYRNLKGMVERDELVIVRVSAQAARYELAGLAHHHHFLCESCDRVFDIPGCPGSIQRLTPDGFETTAHEVTLVGRCQSCA